MIVVVLACLWVLAATVVAMLPMRFQYVPGVILMALAPVLVWQIWQVHGAFAGAFAIFAFLSMFRRPLRYYARKLTGQDDAATKREGAQ